MDTDIILPALSNAGPTRLRDGAPTAAACDFRDSGARNSCLEAFSALAPALILSGTRPERWDDAGTRFLQATGVSRDDPVDRLWTRVFRPRAAARIEGILDRLPADGRPSRGVRASLLLGSGVRRRCVVRACRLPSEPERWFATVTDIDRDEWAATRQTRLRETLRAVRAERDTLVRRLVAAQEEERARISAELHDHLGQNLTALRWALAGRGHGARTDTEDRALRALVDDTDRRIERLMLELRPYAPGPDGLRENLAAALADWSAQHGIPASLDVRDAFPTRLPGHTASTLYRIVLAALHNVARHARASHVHVRLDHVRGVVEGVIEDDGRGFDPAAVMRDGDPRRRSGSLAMAQRARALGGTCSWHASPGQGTRVLVRLPVSLPRQHGPRDIACE